MKLAVMGGSIPPPDSRRRDRDRINRATAGDRYWCRRRPGLPRSGTSRVSRAIIPPRENKAARFSRSNRSTAKLCCAGDKMAVALLGSQSTTCQEIRDCQLSGAGSASLPGNNTPRDYRPGNVNQLWPAPVSRNVQLLHHELQLFLVGKLAAALGNREARFFGDGRRHQHGRWASLALRASGYNTWSNPASPMRKPAPHGGRPCFSPAWQWMGKHPLLSGPPRGHSPRVGSMRGSALGQKGSTARRGIGHDSHPAGLIVGDVPDAHGRSIPRPRRSAKRPGSISPAQHQLDPPIRSSKAGSVTFIGGERQNLVWRRGHYWGRPIRPPPNPRRQSPGASRILNAVGNTFHRQPDERNSNPQAIWVDAGQGPSGSRNIGHAPSRKERTSLPTDWVGGGGGRRGDDFWGLTISSRVKLINYGRPA